MQEEIYNVVFNGEIIGGMEQEVAKKNFSQTFKVTGMRLDAIFSGKPVVLKKKVDYREGMKFRGQLKRLGMISYLNALGDSSEAQKTKLSPNTPETETHAPDVVNDSTSQKGDWSLAPVGSDMNQIKDTRPAVSVDISQISVAPVGADILVEKKKMAVMDVDTSKLSISKD